MGNTPPSGQVTRGEAAQVAPVCSRSRQAWCVHWQAAALVKGHTRPRHTRQFDSRVGASVMWAWPGVSGEGLGFSAAGPESLTDPVPVRSGFWCGSEPEQASVPPVVLRRVRLSSAVIVIVIFLLFYYIIVLMMMIVCYYFMILLF